MELSENLKIRWFVALNRHARAHSVYPILTQLEETCSQRVIAIKVTAHFFHDHLILRIAAQRTTGKI